jgi:hypothetical protein
MTNEQKQVRDWKLKFGQNCPDKPTIPSLEERKLCARLILEEALETIKALGLIAELHYEQPYLKIEDIHFHTYNPDNENEELIPNLLDIIDGCEDLKVVTEGTLVACGCLHTVEHGATGVDSKGQEQETDWEEMIDPHFNEVMRANNEKLWSWIEWTDFWEANEPTDNYTVECAMPQPKDYDRTQKLWLVKDKAGKVIKPPSFRPPNHEQFLPKE